MGAAERWLRSFIGVKKSKNDRSEHDIMRSSNLSKSRRWLGWKTGFSRSRKEQELHKSTEIVSSRYLHCEGRDDFRQHMESWKAHWAAICIQCAFRRLLAKRALKSLKAIVRIQAIVRGRLVRCQVARIRHLSAKLLSYETKREEWCNHQGSFQEIKARHQQKCNGVLKRERALAYANSQHSMPLKKKEFAQSRPKSKQNLKLQMTHGTSEISLSCYNSGPILASLTSSAGKIGLSCTHKHQDGRQECNKERAPLDVTKPGYMEATISMRAKSKSNSNVCSDSRNVGCCYLDCTCPVWWQHRLGGRVETHHLWVHCT